MSQEKSKMSTTELKAKQIMGEFANRLTIVERLCSRLRPLRPPVCTSRRLFDYFEIPDPYHPIDYAKEFKPQVGSSVLVLGENRRPVAPHSKVAPLNPRLDSNKSKSTEFRPQGIPQATKRSAPPPSPPPVPSKKSSGEFGKSSKHPLHKLPVRPDINNTQAQPPSSTPKNSDPTINRSIPRPNKTQRTERGNLRMRRSTINNQQPIVRSLEPEVPTVTTPKVVPETAVNRSPSAAAGGGGLDDLFGFGSSDGMMRIPRRTEAKNTPPTTPTKKRLDDIPPVSQAKPPVPIEKTPVKPINRSPSTAAGGAGLDDLFGFGNPDGRMKIPRRSDSKKSSNSTPVFNSNPVTPSNDPKKS